MKSQLTINTKTKYTESKKYQKHFSLDDRIKIQKIITENRDDNGAMTILLKDILVTFFKMIRLPFQKKLNCIE